MGDESRGELAVNGPSALEFRLKRDNGHALADMLVVDDEEKTAQAISAALSRMGYEARYVLGVEEALLAIELREPDVLVTDQVMGPLHGYDLLVRVKAKHPSVGRILCSSSVNEDLDEVLREQELAYAFVAKTDDFNAITLAVASLIEVRAARGATTSCAGRRRAAP